MVSIIKLPVLAMMAGTVLAVTFPQHIERLEPYIAHSLPQTLEQFLLRSQQQQQPQPHRRNVAYYSEAPTTLTTETTTTTQTTSEEPSYIETETALVQRQLPDEPEFQQITRASFDPTLRRQNRFPDLSDAKKPIHQPKSGHLKSTTLNPKTKFTKKEKKDAIDSSHLMFEEEPTPQGGLFNENHLPQANFEEGDFQAVGHDSSSLFRGATNSVYEEPDHHAPPTHFEHPSSPHFEHTSSPHLEHMPAPQYEISPAPQFEHSPAPHFEHSPSPQFEQSPFQHFEPSSAPHFDPSSTTHFEHSPTANFEHFPSPRFDISASQDASHSGHFSAIPSPHFSSGSGLSNRLGGYRPEPNYFGPAKYHFKYGVRDEHGGNDFGHQESRNGGDTKGVYYVQLPDGRRQTVNYYVNKGSGFVADIKYDGKAHFPPPAKYQGVVGFRAHGGLGGHGGLEGFDGSHGFLRGGGSSINHISGGASEFDVHLPHGLDIHESSPYSSGGLGASLQSFH